MGDIINIQRQLQSVEGIELKDTNELTIENNLYFLYKGQRVLIYIRDQYFNPKFPDREYKYHICNCETIEEKIKNKRFNRYVVATRANEHFLVNIRHIDTRELIKKNEVIRLHVCKNCLFILHYKDYADHYKDIQINFTFLTYPMINCSKRI